jgi:hypothetical protein
MSGCALPYDMHRNKMEAVVIKPGNKIPVSFIIGKVL